MKPLAAIAAAALSCAAVQATDPYIGYIYPAGIQAGTTNLFLIGGQDLRSIQEAHFGSPDVRLLEIERVPFFSPPTAEQRNHLKKWLDGIAGGNAEEPAKPENARIDEWRTNAWWNALGNLDSNRLAIVERYLFTPRNPLQRSPSLREMAIAKIAADAGAAQGMRMFRICNWSGISAPHPFEVSSSPRTAEPLFVPPHRKRPAPPSVSPGARGAVLDGRIMPGETDTFLLRLEGGIPYSFKTAAREFQPYIGDAVPGFFNAIVSIEDERGGTVASADDTDRFRPDPEFSFTPRKSGTYALKIRDVLYRGRADFTYSVAVRKAAAAPEHPHGRDGTVRRPGETSTAEFFVDEPGPRVLEVFARREGSPLDAVLSLRDGRGRILGRWDDATNAVFVGTVAQGEYDPVAIYDFKEAGKYTAEVTDRTGHGGEGYFWRLQVRRPCPSFAVRSARSSLPLRRAAPLKVDFSIVRTEGFTGDVKIEFPEFVRARGNVATSGVDRVSVELFYTGKKRMPLSPARIFASSVTADGTTVRVPVEPCDEYEQAFAWRHLVPAETFVMRGFPDGTTRKGPAGGASKKGSANGARSLPDAKPAKN